MKAWLVSDRGLAVLISVLLVLVGATTALSSYVFVTRGEDHDRIHRLAAPTDREVVERLKRGVHVMTPQDAREVIGTMTRKAQQQKP